MKIDVLVPTLRRVDDLNRCLTALQSQERLPDAVIVTVQKADAETREYLASRAASLPVQVVLLDVPGVVAAMNAGVSASNSDVIAIIDDDTAPFPDWLSRIEAIFAADPNVAGVGGRDWQPKERGDCAVVGKVQWFGRIIGNHHLGAGPAREVDLIKGANCAYRTATLKSIGFDKRLLGKGAQVHWELSLGLALRRAGWKLIYDPAIALDHFVTVRNDSDTFHRGIYVFEGHFNAVHNETLIILDHFSPIQRAAYLLWATVIGHRGDPGLLQVVRLIALRDSGATRRFRSSYLGRIAGYRSWRALAGKPSGLGATDTAPPSAREQHAQH